MSLNRYAKKTDTTQQAIVAALRAIGAAVWVISKPCDLLTFYRGVWRPLECKTTKYKDKRQKAQIDFLTTYPVPVVKTPDEAIYALTGKLHG